MLAAREIQLIRDTIGDLRAAGQADRAEAVAALLATALPPGVAKDSSLADYCTIGQTAKGLGVSVGTVRRWVASGFVRASRVGRRTLIHQAEIDRYLVTLQREQPVGQSRAAAATTAEREIAASTSSLPSASLLRYKALRDRVEAGDQLDRSERAELSELRRTLTQSATEALAETVRAITTGPI